MNDFKVGDPVKGIEGNNFLKRFLEGIISAHAITLVKHDTYLPTNHPKRPEKKAKETVTEKFIPEEFCVLNEKDAEKYTGKDMEFADIEEVRAKDWIRGKLTDVKETTAPFQRDMFNAYPFCRTCPETFKTKDLEKIKSIKESIAYLKSELERLEEE